MRQWRFISSKHLIKISYFITKAGHSLVHFYSIFLVHNILTQFTTKHGQVLANLWIRSFLFVLFWFVSALALQWEAGGRVTSSCVLLRNSGVVKQSSPRQQMTRATNGDKSSQSRAEPSHIHPPASQQGSFGQRKQLITGRGEGRSPALLTATATHKLIRLRSKKKNENLC